MNVSKINMLNLEYLWNHIIWLRISRQKSEFQVLNQQYSKQYEIVLKLQLNLL